jgi:SAM-dependent methyltransferase
VGVRFIQGDMLDVGSALKDELPFQAVVNMFTSHGYHQRDDDLRFFQELHGLSAPGAALVIETLNRDYILRNFTPIGFEEAGSISRYDHRSFDLETSSVHSEWSFYEKDGDNLSLRLRVDLELRAYSQHEIKGLLERAGWEPMNSFTLAGDGTRTTPVGPDDFRMWVTARRV